MEIAISGRHIALTDAMREHVSGKLRHLDKYADLVLRYQATLSTDADKSVAEVIASVRRGANLVAEARAGDMYKAIDGAMAKMEQQLRRHKERLKGHRAKPRGQAPPEKATSQEQET
jgi:putative sigma-54 modulation protein